ncbi:hypothetical protein EDEG_01942 [Edhazardia aedis USNM 41457]|uniref:Uncharacterized protein n=1 Tax=Edhazardia aedis (strain USNM 41457) TaxID=1003232 RepID=J9DQY8_EDHAE|nr:hypothetical protein EDEG_01942 [Edhazardia aedis USNM 41457]|eukprot:EJW03747.1 hypothetical protein EDEG_01942 [Edhazardia aedis USNM 41457]
MKKFGIDWNDNNLLLALIVICTVLAISFYHGKNRYQKYLRKYYKKKVDKVLVDDFQDVLKSGDEDNLDMAHYLKNNISLQGRLWYDKKDKDKTYRVKPMIKTHLHIEMIHKLKVELWIKAISRLEAEYQHRIKSEILCVDDKMFHRMKKKIQNILFLDLVQDNVFSPTENYFELFNILQDAYKMVFLNMGLNYHVDKSIEISGSNNFQKIIQRMEDLKLEHNVAFRTTFDSSEREIRNVGKANMAICEAMEADLYTCFEYLKHLNS